jgi:predicted HD superfamily hydrolase involved in NAD metabolism
MVYDLYKLKKAMAKELSEKRFFHTLGVEAVSFSLAIQYNYDIEKATIAGLLHDCAKCLPDEVLLKQCEDNNLPITDVERRNPFLLHSKLGAYLSKTKYGIMDEEITDAIHYHTTGKTNMTLLQKIIFTADYIEPNRSPEIIPDLNVIRKMAFTNLDEAVFNILSNTINYLNSDYQEIDQLSIDAYEYYKPKNN